MNSLLNFEFSYLAPSVNKMYCHTRKGGLYLHPDELAFKNNITNILKEMIIPEEVIFPIKCSVKQQDKVYSNEKIKFKNCNILKKRSNKKSTQSDKGS